MRKNKLFLTGTFIGCMVLITCLIGCSKEDNLSLEKKLKAGGSVYLTFDDGPTGNTTTLVSKLKTAGAKATFFVWGNRISGNMTGFNAIKNAGFSIQNHSYTHSHMLSWTYQQVYNDIKQCQTAIQNAGGGTPRYFRATVDTKDWNGATTAQIVSACNNLQSGGNPLMHDGYATTNAAIPTIVTNLKNRGLSIIQY